jgi:hypothetical protein
MTRQDANLKILDVLSKFYLENPDFTFGQGLVKLNLMTAMGGGCFIKGSETALKDLENQVAALDKQRALLDPKKEILETREHIDTAVEHLKQLDKAIEVKKGKK